jgi:hypothetical protein
MKKVIFLPQSEEEMYERPFSTMSNVAAWGEF